MEDVNAPMSTILSTDGHTFKYYLPYSSRKPPNVEVRWASKHARRGRPLTPARRYVPSIPPLYYDLLIIPFSVHFADQDMGEEAAVLNAQ